MGAGTMTDYERIKREYDLSLLQKNRLTDKIYPIGSIYMSISEVSPAVLFGGAWERLENVFLLASSSSHPAGEQAGEERVTLSEAEMPSHYHGNIRCSIGQYLSPLYGEGATGHAGVSVNSGNPNYRYYTDSRGDNQPHNNMPPYLSVCMWKRVK